MANWGIGLGAGAEAALRTYTTLEDDKRRKAQDERAERALKLQEESAARAARRAALEEQQEAQRRALFASVLGEQPTGGVGGGGLQIPGGAAGTRMSGALARGGAPGSEVTPEIGAALTPTPTAASAAAPAQGGDEAPRAAIQPTAAPAAAPARRGAIDYDRLQRGLLALGDVKGAEAVGRMMTADEDRALKRIQRMNEWTKLSQSEIDLAMRQYGVFTARAGQLAEQLPPNPHMPLSPELSPQVQAVADQLATAYSMLPDGRRAEVKFNDDGSFDLAFIEDKTGKVVGGQKFTTVGQVQQAARMAGMLTDPVAYNQWITKGKHEAIKAELDTEMKRLENAGKREEVHRLQAINSAIFRFDELMKNPAQNEERLRDLAETLALLAPDKYTEKRKVLDADGNETEVRVNTLMERVDGMVPLQTVKSVSSDGKPVVDTAEKALQRYIDELPALLDEAGGNPDLAIAQLRQIHDVSSGFRRGAFDKYIWPQLKPHFDKQVESRLTQQLQAMRGGGAPQSQPQQAAPERQKFEPFRPGFLRDWIVDQYGRLTQPQTTAPAPASQQRQGFDSRRAADEARERRVQASRGSASAPAPQRPGFDPRRVADEARERRLRALGVQ